MYKSIYEYGYSVIYLQMFVFTSQKRLFTFDLQKEENP